MPTDPLDSALLKRVLGDSATGLPNTLYLEMLRERGAPSPSGTAKGCSCSRSRWRAARRASGTLSA